MLANASRRTSVELSTGFDTQFGSSLGSAVPRFCTCLQLSQPTVGGLFEALDNLSAERAAGYSHEDRNRRGLVPAVMEAFGEPIAA